MKITIFNKLKKYENYLYTAKNANYIRGLSSTQVAELEEIGKELDLSFRNSHCPACVLKFMKQLATPYFEQKEKLELKKEEKKCTKINDTTTEEKIKEKTKNSQNK